MKKIVCIALVIATVFSLICYSAQATSAVMYEITDKTAYYEIKSAELTTINGKLCMNALPSTKNIPMVSWKLDKKYIDAAPQLEISVDSMSNTTISVIIYKLTGEEKEYIYRANFKNASDFADFKINLANIGSSEYDSVILSIFANTSNGGNIVFNKIRLADTDTKAVLPSDEYIIDENTPIYNASGIAVSNVNNYLRVSNTTGVATSSSVFTWRIPYQTIAQYPYLTMDFSSSSTAQTTVIGAWESDAANSLFYESYKTASTLGKKTYDLSGSLSSRSSDDNFIIWIYLVDTSSNGSQFIDFKNVSLSGGASDDSAFVRLAADSITAYDYPVTDKLSTVTLENYTSDGLTFNFAGGGEGNAYWKLPASVIKKTPYLKVRVEDKSYNTAPKICLYVGYSLTDYSAAYYFKTVTDISGTEVFDLRTLLSSKTQTENIYLNLYMISSTAETINFDSFYLSGDNSTQAVEMIPVNSVLLDSGNGLIPFGISKFHTAGSSFTLPSANTAQGSLAYWTDGVNNYNKDSAVNVTGDKTYYAIYNYCGDLNDDSKVDIYDLVLCKNIILGKGAYDANADYDDSGFINIIDFLQMKNTAFENMDSYNEDSSTRNRLSKKLINSYINITAYGALGNGTTDCSGAFAAAVSAAQSSGRSVYVPAGNFRMATSIVLPESVELVFDVGACFVFETNSGFTINGQIEAGDWIIFKNGVFAGTPENKVGNPIWFGATGDGVTDDSAAFVKALALFSQVDVPSGNYRYRVSGISLQNNQTIQGREGNASLVGFGTNPIITISGTQYCNISKLDFYMEDAVNATCIYFDNSTAGKQKCKVTNVNFYDCGTAITDSNYIGRNGSNDYNRIITATLENINVYRGRKTAIVLNDFWGFIFLTNINLDYTNTPASAGSFNGLYVQRNEGMIITNVNVKGNGANGCSHGMYLENCIAVWVNNSSAQNVLGSGIVFEGSRTQHLYIRNTTATGCENYGIYISCSSTAQLDNCTVTGNGQGGFWMSGNYFMVTNCEANNNTGNGFSAEGLNYSTLSFLKSANNTGYGAYDSSTANSYVVITASGNTSGNYNSNVGSRYVA